MNIDVQNRPDRERRPTSWMPIAIGGPALAAKSFAMVTLLARACPTLLVLVAAWSICLSLGADEPKAEPDPCVTDLTEEKLDNPPERKTKFEVVEEVWQERLVDVKTADQKYVARIRILLPKRSGSPFDAANRVSEGGRFASGLIGTRFVALQTFRGRLLLDPSGYSGVSFETPAQQETAVDAFKRMLAQIPDERLPAKEVRDFFVAAENDRMLLTSRGRDDPRFSTARQNPLERELRILATKPEVAQERARTLLSILDQGFTRPIQVALFKVRLEVCQALKETDEKLPASKKGYDTISAKLKEYEEFTPDMLPGLRVQQLQLEVDMAGVRARLDTCEKLLAKVPRESDRRKQIEDAKVSAEIELSGFEARRTKSAEFVAKVKERINLSEMRIRADNDVATLRHKRNQLVGSIRAIDEEIEAFGPVRLVDDKVTIHPLEWTQ